jgi:hypothetical protein
MDGSIRELLDPRVLTQAYRQVPPPESDDLAFSRAFFVNPERVDAATYRGLYEHADLKAAPTNEIGAEAQILSVGQDTERVYTLVNSFNKIKYPMDVLTALREEGSYSVQKRGATEVGKIQRKFARRNQRLRNLWIAKGLVTGTIYINKEGEILESSSGAVKTCSLEPNSDQSGTCGGLVSSGSFPTASTDIPAVLQSIVTQAATNGKPIPTDIWVNRANLGEITSNNFFQGWGQYSGEYARDVLQGYYKKGMLTIDIPNLWGFDWHFVGSYYTDYAGTNRAYIPASGAGSMIMTPPPGGEWMKATEGLTLVPSTIGVMGDVDSALASAREEYGMYSYAKLTDDPFVLWAYMGDLFGWNLPEPDAIWRPQAF